MENLIERFADDLAHGGVSPQTRKNYLAHVGRFLAHQSRPPETLGAAEAWDWLTRLRRDEGLCVGYLSSHLNALRIFYYTITLQKPEGVARLLNPCETGPVPARPFSHDEMDRLLSELPTDTTRTAISVAYGGGMTLHEVCRLMVADIDSRKMLVRIRRHGKHRWDAFVPLDTTTLALLREHWRRTRPPAPWVFTGPDHAPLNPSRPQGELREAAGRLNFPLSQLDSVLRYSFLLRRLQDGAALHEVRHILRHTSIRTLPSAVLSSKGGRP